MLRTLLRLRVPVTSLTSARHVDTGQEVTRDVIRDVEHIIKPKQKPIPEATGMEKESYEPVVFENDHGELVSSLGESRAFITKCQEPFSVEPQLFRYKLRLGKIRTLRLDQQYDINNLMNLGPDLLATIFILTRGGRVRFVDENDWFTFDQKVVLMAYTKETCPLIEEIDASKMSIVFEGFDYFRGLKGLKYLDLSKSHRLDDHSLFKLAFHLPQLEYLNLSHCPNISERGLACLHSLTNLRRLVVNDVKGVTQKQLVCLLLEECNPELFIEGVTYSKDTIDSEIEEDRQKYEQRYQMKASEDLEDLYLSNSMSKVKWAEKLTKYLPRSSGGFFSRLLDIKGQRNAVDLSKVKHGL